MTLPGDADDALSIAERFRKTTGSEPQVVCRAPGRINLIGEHVDYQDGLVVPGAINRYVFAAARAIEQPEFRFFSSIKSAPVVVPFDQTTPLRGDDSWANYAYGVVAEYRKDGHSLPGFEAVFDSNIPEGAGLSSSAAFESSTALLVEQLSDRLRSPEDRALLCQRAEHHWAGVPCGIMDQTASNCGIKDHAIRLDCRSREKTPLALSNDFALVVVNSGVRHALVDGEYASRHADCASAAESLRVPTLRDVSLAQVKEAKSTLGERIFKRAHHVASEIARVEQFTTALTRNDTLAAGQLMKESHASLRDDYEVSCSELNQLVDLASELGAIGARMMGGGFGGSTINLVSREKVDHFAPKIVQLARDRHQAEVESMVVSLVDGAQFL